MVRFLVVFLGIGGAGCSLFPDLGALSGGVDSGSGQDAPPEAAVDSGVDAPLDATLDASDADAGDGATCPCSDLVSAYRFSNASDLGHDYLGNNNMTTVNGAPKQSTTTPNGLPGYSIELDGSSTVCINTGFTFDATKDHTLCWWSQPAALADNTNQFAQTCGYDTWTTNTGADYLWRVNNCDTGTPSDLQVANVYSVGTWRQICQTYESASLLRTVVIDGQTTQKHVITDPGPIIEVSTEPWCIGSYGSGGFWTGLIYRPMWFDRILTDAEIQQVYATGLTCCVP